MSELEETFAFQLRSLKMVHEREYRFHPSRRWRADFAFPDSKLLVEIEGGTWINGRHTRGSGFLRDLEKYNTAAALGWTVFRFAGEGVKNGEAVKMVKSFLDARGGAANE